MRSRREYAPTEDRATVLHTDVLAAATVAVLLLLIAREHYEPWLARGYLVWNLFLAWIPYVCAGRSGARDAARLRWRCCCRCSPPGSSSCRTRPTS